jgi:hypothetical protein
MTDAMLYGPCMYRSTCDSEVKIADDHNCIRCKQPVGTDRPYHFWFRGSTVNPEDMRYAHVDCYEKWLKNK